MKKIGLLVLLLGLAACGFRPLYVERTGGKFYYDGKFDASVVNEMSKIKVSPISERFGQQIRNNLLDLLTPKGTPQDAKYFLKAVVSDKTVSQQAMQSDVTATNERIKYVIKYELRSDKETLVTGDSVAFVSYDILANPYSTTMAQKKAEEDAAKVIADDIALRLGAYFHSQLGTENDL